MCGSILVTVVMQDSGSVGNSSGTDNCSNTGRTVNCGDL